MRSRRNRIVLLLFLSVALGSWFADVSAQSGLVRISDPNADSVVTDDAVEVGGTYNLKITEDIWVLVWPAKAPMRFWPQSDDADSGKSAIKQDGKWRVLCSLGGPAQKYEIAVYTATKAASTTLSVTLKKWAENNRYPGLTKLPEGMTEHDRIVVQKRK